MMGMKPIYNKRFSKRFPILALIGVRRPGKPVFRFLSCEDIILMSKIVR